MRSYVCIVRKLLEFKIIQQNYFGLSFTFVKISIKKNKNDFDPTVFKCLWLEKFGINFFKKGHFVRKSIFSTLYLLMIKEKQFFKGLVSKGLKKEIFSTMYSCYKLCTNKWSRGNQTRICWDFTANMFALNYITFYCRSSKDAVKMKYCCNIDKVHQIQCILYWFFSYMAIQCSWAKVHQISFKNSIRLLFLVMGSHYREWVS